MDHHKTEQYEGEEKGITKPDTSRSPGNAFDQRAEPSTGLATYGSHNTYTAAPTTYTDSFLRYGDDWLGPVDILNGPGFLDNSDDATILSELHPQMGHAHPQQQHQGQQGFMQDASQMTQQQQQAGAQAQARANQLAQIRANAQEQQAASQHARQQLQPLIAQYGSLQAIPPQLIQGLSPQTQQFLRQKFSQSQVRQQQAMRTLPERDRRQLPAHFIGAYSSQRGGDPSPNPNDMQRRELQHGSGTEKRPNADIDRGEPTPGIIDINDLPPPMRAQLLALKGQLVRPPSSHPMANMTQQQQLEMLRQQQEAQMPNGQFPSRNVMTPPATDLSMFPPLQQHTNPWYPRPLLPRPRSPPIADLRQLYHEVLEDSPDGRTSRWSQSPGPTSPEPNDLENPVSDSPTSEHAASADVYHNDGGSEPHDIWRGDPPQNAVGLFLCNVSPECSTLSFHRMSAWRQV